jgi:hypothetical protein
MTKNKKHRQHKNVSMDQRGHLKLGGVVLPYYPAYYWNGMYSGTTNAGTITTATEGGNHAGDAGTGDGGAGADSGGSL